MSFSEKSPSDLLSTSSTPNGAPSPCRITLMARRTPCYGEQFGRAKALLVFELVGDDGLAGAQSKSRGRLQVGTDRGRADQAFIPADTAAQEEAVLARQVFEDLAELGLQSLRRQADGLGQQFFQRCAAQRNDPKFGQDLLLPNARTHGTITDFRFWRRVRRCLDHRTFWIGRCHGNPKGYG